MKAFLSVIFVFIVVAMDPRMFGESAGAAIMALILFTILFFKKIKQFDFNNGVFFVCCLLIVSSILHLFFKAINIFGIGEPIILIVFNFWFSHIMSNFILNKKLNKNQKI